MTLDETVTGRRSLVLARVLTVACGLCAVAWAISVLPVFRDEVGVVAAARRILSGEQYRAEQLNDFNRELDQRADASFRSSTLSQVAIVRLKVAEEQGALAGTGTTPAADSLARSIGTALSNDPTESFLWLVAYWLQGLHLGAAADPRLLQMSYLTGPDEGWVASRRNPAAVAVFSSLPDDLRDRVVAEFAGLVRSDLGQNAANILAGPGRPIRDKLLEGLARLDESSRGRFLKWLDTKDSDGRVPQGARESIPRL